MEEKICNHCEESKTLDNFYYRENRNLYETNCRKCNAQLAKEKRKDESVKESIKKSQQLYRQKNKDKLLEKEKAYRMENRDRLNVQNKQYYKDNADKLKEMARLNREHLKEQALTGQLEKPIIKEKTCTTCNQTQDISNFTFRKTRNVYESVCKTCNTEREKEHRRLHKDKINARRKEIQKPLTTEQKIKQNLRKRVNSFIENREGKNMYLKLLSCDKEFLIKWFEYHFKLDEHQEMNWDNYGDYWHIDHVTPCASFDLTNEDHQKQCFHWANLSPVLKEYNLSKGAKIKHIDQMRQEIRVKKFLKTVEVEKKTQKLKYSMKS